MKTTTSQSEYQSEMTLTFGQAIRTARTSIGYTQRELATLVEIDSTYLSKKCKRQYRIPAQRVCNGRN